MKIKLQFLYIISQFYGLFFNFAIILDYDYIGVKGSKTLAETLILNTSLT